MDNQHWNDLERILENRRLHGRLLKHGQQPAAPPKQEMAATGSQTPSPVRQTAATSTTPTSPLNRRSSDFEKVPVEVAARTSDRKAGLVQPQSFHETGGQPSEASFRQTSPPRLQPHQSSFGGSNVMGSNRASSPVDDLQTQLSTLQDQVDKSHRDQKRQLEMLQAGMVQMTEAIQAGATSPGARRAGSIRPRQGGSMMLPVPRLVPQPFQSYEETRMRSPPQQRTLNARSPRAVSFRADGTAARIGDPRPATVPVLGGTNAPREPPAQSRPYTTTTSDLESSLAMMRAGQWFLKWNATGQDVKPKYVWLDAETFLLQWGNKQKSSGFLSGSIKLEEIIDVGSTQLVEHQDTGARVFYILLIRTPQRVLRLGTEKREKLDSWFSAIQNVIAYYRSQGQMVVARYASSGD